MILVYKEIRSLQEAFVYLKLAQPALILEKTNTLFCVIFVFAREHNFVQLQKSPAVHVH